MIRATQVIPAADVNSTDDTIELDFDHRHRRRFAMTSHSGREFLLDLPRAAALQHGDGLLLEDGRVIVVQAKPEPVADITATDTQHMNRIAWHLGNRHLPTEIHSDFLRIREDHVIVDMVRQLGGEVELKLAPFHPEGGAYSGHSHAH
tara:strand:- start:1938 stop:2381 length:444 start_codon:yes stop_codon:yes gene_type:complete